jgi:hypothetical protein
LPFEIDPTVTIVDVKVLDSCREAMTFSTPRTENKELLIDVEVDTNELWKHIRLIDSDDREWYTDDKGQTWHSGLMSFTIPDEVAELEEV